MHYKARTEKPADAETPETIAPLWQPFTPDADEAFAFFAGKIKTPKLELWAVRIDLSEPQVRIFCAAGSNNQQPRPEGTGYVASPVELHSGFNTFIKRPEGRGIKPLSTNKNNPGTFFSIKVSRFVEANNLLAGINALPFEPASGKEGEYRKNIGIVISDGHLLSPPHPVFDALVFYTDGSAAIIPQRDINSAVNIENAVGGFYQILTDGQLSEHTENSAARHPRSAAGISGDGNYLYLLVIDGRRAGSIGSTEAETALILKQLGAWNGINLDGGGSSSLALRFPDGKITVVNTPIHHNIPGTERAVAGCLGVGIK